MRTKTVEIGRSTLAEPVRERHHRPGSSLAGPSAARHHPRGIITGAKSADSGAQVLPPAGATVPPITSSARRRIDFLTIPPPSLPSIPRRPPARPANGVTTITLARPTFLWYQGFRCRVNP